MALTRNEIIILIAVTITVFIIIGILFFILIVNTSPTPTNLTTSNITGNTAGESCLSNSDCQNGLICSSNICTNPLAPITIATSKTNSNNTTNNKNFEFIDRNIVVNDQGTLYYLSFNSNGESIWTTTDNSYKFSFDSSNKRLYVKNNSLNINNLRQICINSSGRLYICDNGSYINIISQPNEGNNFYIMSNINNNLLSVIFTPSSNTNIATFNNNNNSMIVSIQTVVFTIV